MEADHDRRLLAALQYSLEKNTLLVYELALRRDEKKPLAKKLGAESTIRGGGGDKWCDTDQDFPVICSLPAGLT